MDKSKEEEAIKLVRRLKSKGLTPKQILAGTLYYFNFCSKLDIPLYKCERMIVNMIENMRKGIVGQKNKNDQA